MNFIKAHWFGILIWIWLTLVFLFAALIVSAPHYDARNRGFAFCSQQLIDDLHSCNHSVFCSSEMIIRSTKCDLKVVAASFSDWMAGKHQYPWSGYIFVPELPQDYLIDEESRREYLKEYPDTAEEMLKLQQLRKDMENAQNQAVIKQEIINIPSPSGMGLD